MYPGRKPLGVLVHALRGALDWEAGGASYATASHTGGARSLLGTLLKSGSTQPCSVSRSSRPTTTSRIALAE